LTPTLILAGDKDDLVPWANNQFLADHLPNSKVHALDATHFAWEEESEEYARLAAEWILGGHRKAGP